MDRWRPRLLYVFHHQEVQAPLRLHRTQLHHHRQCLRRAHCRLHPHLLPPTQRHHRFLRYHQAHIESSHHCSSAVYICLKLGLAGLGSDSSDRRAETAVPRMRLLQAERLHKRKDHHQQKDNRTKVYDQQEEAPKDLVAASPPAPASTLAQNLAASHSPRSTASPPPTSIGLSARESIEMLKYTSTPRLTPPRCHFRRSYLDCRLRLLDFPHVLPRPLGQVRALARPIRHVRQQRRA